ncbi:hypothetical protein SMD11_2621 [Streptomyces albireticuli]|uniref:Uncharacterized protein n=1 Tax=Streptomyces albireticuli TaxID=1940 RepID=A0A1Z2L1U9_9ACTN|nr:hypothetical protein SMD11_2621 [Streptomyces albireticuli]
MVVAEGLADAEVGEDDGGDAQVEGFQGGRGADRHQQVRTGEDLAHVPVHQTAVGRQAARQAGGQLLVREFLDVRGVLTGLAAELDEHLPPGVQAGVLGRAAQEVRAVLAALGYGGLGGEHDGERTVLGVRVTSVTGLPSVRSRLVGVAEERQRPFRDGAGRGAHPLVHGPEPVRVVGRVGEDDVRAVAQEEAVGELLVDDADVAGDDDGADGRGPPGVGEAVQRGLDGAADAGQHDDVVPRPVGAADELGGRDLAEALRAHPDLGQLAARRGRAPPQQPAVETGARGEAVRRERAPFPPGVGVGEHGDPRRRGRRTVST